ncbi:hypothetical protein SDC9_207511 [bioreactor metagenome]|uniref:Uncharacterized protein n=1 Tax=bioreactor metagenome TaxID=1076179 RepID=A0A645JAN0_9ZZZZ
MFQVVFQKAKLILPITSPVTFTVPRVGIEDIVEDDEMGIPVIERVVGTPEVLFKRLIRELVGRCIIIHVVVPHHVVPG